MQFLDLRGRIAGSLDNRLPEVVPVSLEAVQMGRKATPSQVPASAPPRHARLEQIPTDWSLVRLAHSDSVAAVSARDRLLEQYRAAVETYVHRFVDDSHLADDICQEFFVRFLRGSFRHADAGKGEFGVLLKTSLRHLVVRFLHCERRRRQIESLSVLAKGRRGDGRLGAAQRYRAEIRDALLDGAWEQLRHFEDDHPRNLHFTALKLRAYYGEDETTEELAGLLSTLVERRISPNAFRILLHDARGAFASALWRAAQVTVENGDPAAARQLLKELGLWHWGRPLLR